MKKVVGQIKLQILAGKATPAPPVGPALGQAGVNIMDFCKAFNAKTQKDEGLIIPVVITVYADRSYTFITKTPPVAVLIVADMAPASAYTSSAGAATLTVPLVVPAAMAMVAPLDSVTLTGVCAAWLSVAL